MNTLIFLGGEKPSVTLSSIAATRANVIIAADSGYHAVSEAGLQPHIVTGDFDSIGQTPQSDSFKVIPAPEQDATDFEKALRHLPEDCQYIEILGGTGLRSDHFLTNLLIAAGLSPDCNVVFHDDTQSIYRVTPTCPLVVKLNAETVVSLIPFSEGSGVTTEGLHWDLCEEDMGPASQLGQSNRSEKETVRISLKTGMLYAIINHPNGFA